MKLMVAAVAIMSTITTVTTPPMMATVLSEPPRVVGDDVITVTGTTISVCNNGAM
jgi:hypothetical protein